MKYHPDVNSDNNRSKHETMCKINEAYSILKDAESRMLYDESLKLNKETYEETVNESSVNKQENQNDRNHSKSYESYQQKMKRYNYYNRCDLNEYEQEDFIYWQKSFFEYYILLAVEYFKKI